MRAFPVAFAIAASFAAFSGYVMWKHAQASHWSNDEATYRFEAQTFARGMLFAKVPPDADAFHLPMVLVRDGKRFGQYYPGYPLLLAAGVVLGVDWLVNPLLGGLLVFGVFLLGRRLFGSVTGIVASGIVAISPLVQLLATTFLSHVACATLLVFAGLALARGLEDPAAARLAGPALPRFRIVPSSALGGFLLGWATAARPFTGVLFALAFGVILLGYLKRRGSDGLPNVLSFGLGALPWAIALFGWNWFLTGSPFLSPYAMKWPLDGLGFHEISPTRRFLQGQLVDRYTPGIAWIATQRQLASFAESFLPGGAWSACVLILPLVFARKLGRVGVLLALFPISLAAGHFFYPGTTGISAVALGPRYYSEGLPAIALLLARSATLLAATNRWAPHAIGLAGAGILGVGLIHSMPGVVKTVQDLHSNPVSGPNRLLERHLRSLEPESRVVFVDISTYNAQSAILLNRPDFEGDNIVAIYLEPARNRTVLDAFPGRSAFLARWDSEKGMLLVPYVPEEDREGPPQRFPYTRKQRFRDAGAEEEEGDPRAAEGE